MCFSDEPNSLLVIVIDTNPVWWGQRLIKHDGDVRKCQFIAQSFAVVFSFISSLKLYNS